MVSTVTPHSDMAPSPRVVVDIDDADLHPDTVTVTVLQLSAWGEVAVNKTPRAAAGGLVLTDYTLPPGIVVTYRVEQFDASGASLGYALSLQTQVTIPVGWVVVQDPLAPTDAALVRAEAGFGAELRRTRDMKRYVAGGRTFAMSSLYSAFTGVPLRCFTETAADRGMVARILEQPLILIRSMPQMRLPGAFYAAVAVVPMVPVDAHVDGDMDVWDLTGDQVSPPDIDVLVAVYTYDRYKAYLDEKYPPFGTYDDAAAEWATYLEAMRNPPPED